MATFLDLQTRVKRRLIDSPASVLAEVPDLVNEALTSLQNAHDFKIMENRKAYLTAADTTLLVDTAAPGTVADNIPLDYKSFRKKPTMQTVVGDHIPLFAATDLNEARIRFGVTSGSSPNDGEPRVITEGPYGFSVDFPSVNDPLHRRFEVWPTSDSNSDWGDGEYRIHIYYWYYLARLAADNDTNWFLTQDPTIKYIIRKAVAEGFLIDWDEERAGVWEARATQALEEAKIADKMYRLSAVDTLVPFRGAREPRTEY